MNHEMFMQRCMELAQRGSGLTAPNPLVGCMIVHDGYIIGEGHHEKFGASHAEVNAINNVKDQSLLPHSILYVNLEPCVHYGKTPPCADLIIEKKIPEVIIGCTDPNPLVSGKGIEKLQNAGVKLQAGVLEDSCKELNKRFITFHEKKRPYVILKWAQTRDGFIAPPGGQRRNISNEYSRTLVHRWRSEEASILVGTETALKDNPRLDARNWNNRNPTRLAIDRNLKIPQSHHLLDHSIPTIIFTELEQSNSENLTFVKLDFADNVVRQISNKLHELTINSVLVEGGAKLLQLFIQSNLWDEARIFTAPVFLQQGIAAPKIGGNIISKTAIEEDELIILKPT